METRTYKDRAEYLKKRVVEKRRNLKLKAIEYKGGKCQICGYSRCVWVLEFHHTNPEEKSFSIGAKGYTRSWQKVQEELDKCILLCSNCHREVEAGFTKISSPVTQRKSERLLSVESVVRFHPGELN